MTRSRFKIVAFSIDSNFFFNNVAIYNQACAQQKLSPLLERSFLNGLLDYGSFDGVSRVVMSATLND